MSYKPFLYFLAEKDGRVRQLVNGVVTSLNKKTPLPDTPDGWQGIAILWERSLTRWGQVRNYSLPLGFVLTGGYMVKNDYYRFNIDRELDLLIKRFVCEVNDTHYKRYYKQMYKGELDFSTFDDVKADGRVNMNIMEGGNSKLIKANENTRFFIPFDEDAISILMDGIVIEGSYKWVIAEQTEGATGLLPTMVLVGNEQKAPGIAVFDVQGGYTFSFAGINAESTPYFMSFADSVADIQGGTGHFTGTIYLSDPDPDFPAGVRLWRYNTITGVLTNELLFVGPEQGAIPIDYTVNINAGDRFFLQIDEYHLESNLTFKVNTRYKSTSIKAFRPIDVYKKLCAKLGIEPSKVVSTLLENSTYCLTSGDGLRGFTEAGITTSFNDFCKAYDVYHFAGVAIRDTVEMEGRDKYFVPDSITPAIELGEIKELNPTPAIDLMYSSIKIGHEEQDIQDVNGKYDFNGVSIYTTPMKRVSREMDLQSPYKAGPYEIELTRVNFENKTTTDGKNDNNVFVLDTDLSASKTFTAELIFFNGDVPVIFFPNTIKNLFPGQVLTITNTGFNNSTFTIVAVAAFISGTVSVVVAEAVIDETVNATVEITTGFAYRLDRSVIPDSGVPDPESIFNVRLRPAALFEVHKRWIGSMLYGYDDEVVEFQDSNRNEDLVVNGLADNRDFPISSLGPRIFIPDYLDFICSPNISLQDELDLNPNRCFAFIYNAIRYTGFMFKAGLAPNDRKEQGFKLLSSIENNRLNLIK